MEITGAAEKLGTMMNSSQPQANIFFQLNSLGALPSLWLQAKLTISLTSIQDKFARLFMSIAAELWLRDAIDTVEVFSPLLLRSSVVGVLLQSVRVNLMPGWLLFVILGILAGGIPGFCIELCCFSHPLWPLFLFLCLLCLLLGWGHYYHGTQAVIMHELR